MPEMSFTIRWPDGTAERCYSPSLVVHEHLEAGAEYPLDDFLHRARTALTIASDRVRAKYGFPCSRAAAQLARLETAGAGFADHPGASVRVVSLDPV